jgi:hypothetical protein
MLGGNPVAVAVATVVAFLLSGGYYAVLSGRLARLSPAYAEPGGTSAVKVVLELVRTMVVAVVIAGLVGATGVDGLGPALLLAVLLWVGFPAVLLSGSVLHEAVPPQLAAIHAGDWLLKLLVITGIVGAWRS